MTEDMLDGNGGFIWTQTEIEEKWSHFFQDYGYYSDLTKISMHYPQDRSLYISYSRLEEYDEDFAIFVLENANMALESARNLLRKYISEKGTNYSFLNDNSIIINLRILELPEDIKLNIRDIRSTHVGKIISVSGIIRKNTEVMPRLYNAAFQCIYCDEITYTLQKKGKQESPERCRNDLCPSNSKESLRAKFKLVPEISEFIDTQKIEIQENPESISGGSQPLRLTAIIEDDIAGKLFPGDRVYLDGILMAEQKMYSGNPLTEFSIYLYVMNFTRTTQELDEVEITPEDEEEIKRLSREPDVIKLFSKSIAPSIYDHDEIKTTLVLQMFGGVRKTNRDGMKLRGDIHVLIIGDPGTAKSQFLRYMADISPRAVMAIGKGASAAGLTAAAVRDEFGEGRWTLEAGALVLADNGFVALDELDKMDEKDTSSMHEAMEQQTVTISKAGIMATLRSRCSILAAANPRDGRFNENENALKQIDFPFPLISRFDVIFKLVDVPEMERDSNLAQHVLYVHRMGEVLSSMESKNLSAEIREDQNIIPPIDREMIRKYVAYAKRNIVPKMSDEAIRYIREEYVRLRMEGTRVGKYISVPITTRQLESAIRLSEAAAKARLSEIVTLDDAILGFSIIRYYMTKLSPDEKPDADFIMTGKNASIRADLETMTDIFKDLKRRKQGMMIKESEFLNECVKSGLEKSRVANLLKEAIETGIFFRPGNGEIELT